MLLTLISSVSALTFEGDTRYSKDNINYIFKEGLTIDEFDILSTGIIIDDYKYGFTLEGGVIDVSFYALDDIEVKSSVPQKVRIGVTLNGVRQYLNENGTIYVDSYQFGTQPVRFSLQSSESGVEGDYIEFVDSDVISRQKWSERALFEFEYDTTTDEQGIITGETVKLTNLNALVLLGVILVLIVIGVILWRR